jgi:hypothetical protein
MSRPRRNKDIEKELMEAIDRLRAAGDDVNYSSVTREAKRARGILSKGTSGYSAVRERIAQIQAEVSPAPAALPKDAGRSSSKQLQALIQTNRELSREVINLRSSLVALIAAQGDIDRLEPQIADMQRRQAARADRLALESVVS